MNEWIVWPVGLFLYSAAGWVLFAFFERYGMNHPKNKDAITLSMFCYTVGSKFPLSILASGVIIGSFLGGLGVHFFWHWCPPGSVSTGMLLLPFQFTGG